VKGGNDTEKEGVKHCRKHERVWKCENIRNARHKDVVGRKEVEK
jgi:hypothetical protein